MKRIRNAVTVAAVTLTAAVPGTSRPAPSGTRRREDDRLAAVESRLGQIEQEVSEMRDALARLADGVTTMLEPRIEQELERRLQGA